MHDGNINELWLVATRIIIVTTVEILRLIIDVCVSKYIWKWFDWTIFIKCFEL